MVASSNAPQDPERIYSLLCLILLTVSTYVFTVIIILTMCCGKEKKEENEEQAIEAKRGASRTISTKSSALEPGTLSAPRSRKPPQKKLHHKPGMSKRKTAPPPKVPPGDGEGETNDEAPKVLPVDQIFPYANAPGKEEEHSRLIGISFASTMAKTWISQPARAPENCLSVPVELPLWKALWPDSMVETSESKSKEKLGQRLPAPTKAASSPPAPAFLRKTMIRTTTKEDDEAQNPMLLEMDPATIYKNAAAAKKDSSASSKNVSTYNKIVAKKNDKDGDLKSGSKMDAGASVMKDAYTSKKDDLMMAAFSVVPRAPDEQDRDKSKKKIVESQYTPIKKRQ